MKVKRGDKKSKGFEGGGRGIGLEGPIKRKWKGGQHLKGSIPQCSQYRFLSYHQCASANRNITPANKL